MKKFKLRGSKNKIHCLGHMPPSWVFEKNFGLNRLTDVCLMLREEILGATSRNPPLNLKVTPLHLKHDMQNSIQTPKGEPIRNPGRNIQSGSAQTRSLCLYEIQPEDIYNRSQGCCKYRKWNISTTDGVSMDIWPLEIYFYIFGPFIVKTKRLYFFTSCTTVV